MSLLQNEDFIIWHLRTSYLSEVKDGVGDRLISINSSILNTSCFRAAGWSTHQGPNPAASPRRTYSPPIPTAIAVASEYFQLPGRGPNAGGSTTAQNENLQNLNATRGGGQGYAGAKALSILDDAEEDEGGMVTGGKGSTNTIGLREHRRALGKKSRRRPKQSGAEHESTTTSTAGRRSLEDEDSSDLSDESDEDADGVQRAVQQIKFTKMPIRRRADSSPIRDAASRNDGGQNLAPPSAGGVGAGAGGSAGTSVGGNDRNRSGSLSVVEAVKSRARADTVTSSEMSSENEVGSDRTGSSTQQQQQQQRRRRIQFARRKQVSTVNEEEADPDQSFATSNIPSIEGDINVGDETGLEEEEMLEEEGDITAQDDLDSVMGSPMSSLDGTAGSTDLLNAVGLGDGLQSTSTPPGMIGELPQKIAAPGSGSGGAAGSPSKRSAKAGVPPIENLPPSRPISTFKPVSLLSAALQAQKKTPANPVEKFAKFFGKGTTETPLYIKIYFSSSSAPTQPYELPILKEIKHATDSTPVTVAETIGVALWRYVEEGVQPALDRDMLNVNKWCLRMVEDEEVDYDFPALGPNRPMVDFTSNNNRAAAGRARSRSKPFDEFALVKASEEEMRKNQELNPRAEEEDEGASPESSDLLAVPAQNVPQQPPQKQTVHRNPILGQPFPSALDDASLTPADLPAVPTTQATPRMGVKKTLKIHYIDPDANAQVTTMNTSTDSYLAEVLDSVCKKWGLEKGTYVLKVTGSTTIAPLDRTVEALGQISDLDLVRRRFGAAPITKSGIGHSPGSSSPNAPLFIDTGATTPDRHHGHHHHHGHGHGHGHGHIKKSKKAAVFGGSSSQATNRMLHPLTFQPDLLGGYQRRYHVIRKQSMSFTASNQRIIAFDNDYLHIMPADNTATGGGGLIGGGARGLFENSSAKTRSISFNDVIGSKVSRRHPKSFRIVVLRGNDTNEQKRYDFEARNVAEAAEIVEEVKKNMMLYRI